MNVCITWRNLTSFLFCVLLPNRSFNTQKEKYKNWRTWNKINIKLALDYFIKSDQSFITPNHIPEGQVFPSPCIFNIRPLHSSRNFKNPNIIINTKSKISSGNRVEEELQSFMHYFKTIYMHCLKISENYWLHCNRKEMHWNGKYGFLLLFKTTQSHRCN